MLKPLPILGIVIGINALCACTNGSTSVVPVKDNAPVAKTPPGKSGAGNDSNAGIPGNTPGSKSATCDLLAPKSMPATLNIVEGAAPDKFTIASLSTVMLSNQRADGTIARFCSGTLVQDDLIVTAAHCLHDHNGTEFFAEVSATGYSPERRVKLKKWQIHPQYVHDGSGVPTATPDIAWGILEKKIPGAMPASIINSSSEDARTGEVVQHVGYGLNQHGVRDNAPLQKMQYSVVEETDSQTLNTFFSRPLGSGETDSGDSGGAVFVRRGNKDVLAAILFSGEVSTSRLTNQTRYRSGSIRLSSYLQWLDQSTGRTLAGSGPKPECESFIKLSAFPDAKSGSAPKPESYIPDTQLPPLPPVSTLPQTDEYSFACIATTDAGKVLECHKMRSLTSSAGASHCVQFVKQVSQTASLLIESTCPVSGMTAVCDLTKNHSKVLAGSAITGIDDLKAYYGPSVDGATAAEQKSNCEQVAQGTYKSF